MKNVSIYYCRERENSKGKKVRSDRHRATYRTSDISAACKRFYASRPDNDWSIYRIEEVKERG